jgi:3-oxoacyl-[acyl-carrier protein] reductase
MTHPLPDGPRPTALVTGGGTGIGRATSLLLARRGHPVVVNYSRSADDAATCVEAITNGGGRAVAIQADVSDDEAARAMVAEANDAFGAIGVIVSNAGTTEHLAMDDLEGATDEIFTRLFAVNVLGAWHTVRAAADDLRATHGAVVMVGSIAGDHGVGSSVPYAVSKAALHGLTRSLAHSLSPEVRVNAVAPGLVLTRWWAGMEERARGLVRATLTGRPTSPEDVARVIADVAEAKAMTGQIVTVDAGQTL